MDHGQIVQNGLRKLSVISARYKTEGELSQTSHIVGKDRQSYFYAI